MPHAAAPSPSQLRTHRPSKRELPIGINIDGVLDHDGLPWPTAAERFARIAASRAFDYIEKNFNPAEDPASYPDLAAQHNLPLRVMGGIYLAGQDERRIADEIGMAGRWGAQVFNMQLFARHADGHELSDLEVAKQFLFAMEHGARSGCLPSFEVHIDMWSEDFRRIERVAALLARHHVPLRVTLDHSHLLFKVDSPDELAASGITLEVASGQLVLRPDGAPEPVYATWLKEGWVAHAHTRSVQLRGKPNPLMARGDGRPGRGVQYPLVRPPEGSYHQAWDEAELRPWKQAVAQLLSFKAQNPACPVGQVSCEFIPFADYGGGVRYSIFDQNVACAQWLRELWQAACAETQATALA
jgi:hypothetical protein